MVSAVISITRNAFSIPSPISGMLKLEQEDDYVK